MNESSIVNFKIVNNINGKISQRPQAG
jgi:hypothetical protein